MKKVIAFVTIIVLVFSLSACKEKNPYKELTNEQISEKVEESELFNFTCYYSADNNDKTDDSILVHLPADVYDSEKDVFYDEDGDTQVIFYGEKVFYDKETGEVVNEEDLEIGDVLEVVYSGEACSKNPVTIKAIKVYVLNG